MKKLLSIVCTLLTLANLCMVLTTATLAAPMTTADQEDVIYYNDGSYLIIRHNFVENNRGTSEIFTVSHSTTAEFYNKKNEKQWDFTLSATFSVNRGISSVCTSASYSYNIYKSSWHLDSASTSQSGNGGYGYATFKEKVLFVTVDTKNVALSIFCDINGNISY